MSTSPRTVPDMALNRRHWIALAVSTLAGCGGGGSSTAAADPGTGGTGIYALGKIDGFGSVILNGIRFDDSAAIVRLDGLLGSATDLRLGMVAVVVGQRDPDLVNGTAERIDAWSVAQGNVTAVAGGCFTLLGMEIDTGASTVFSGLPGASGIEVGTRLKVWGLQIGASGRNWSATRVEVSTAPDVVATGLAWVEGGRFYLNAVELLGIEPGSLRANELVRVRGSWNTALRGIQVERLDRVAINPDQVSGSEVEIEGVVSALPGNGRLMLGSVEVDISRVSVPTLQVGQRIEVEGIWRGQILEASQIETEDDESHGSAEIEARIEAYTNVGDFVLRGQRCDASAAWIKGGTAADLAVGVRVHVKGTVVGEVLQVSELAIEA
jgi:hypothetical protein